MRINIYAEEITTETEIVTKVVTDEKFGERTFYGIRFYLKSPPELHADPEDDDRSAVTFWIPWTRTLGMKPSDIEVLFRALHDRLYEAVGLEANRGGLVTWTRESRT